MPFEIISIPFNTITKGFHTDDLNKFCINKRILAKEVTFFRGDSKCYWSVFLEYEAVLEQAGKEQTELTDAGQLCYERLKAWRNERAQKEGVTKAPNHIRGKGTDCIHSKNQSQNVVSQLWGRRARKILCK